MTNSKRRTGLPVATQIQTRLLVRSQLSSTEGRQNPIKKSVTLKRKRSRTVDETEGELLTQGKLPQTSLLKRRKLEAFTPASPLTHSSPAPNNKFDCSDDQWTKCVAFEGSFLIAPWNGWEDKINASGYGTLATEDLSQSDLANAIHPLFLPDQFIWAEALPEIDLYRKIQPAMTLASRMLLSAPVMAFLRRVRYGSEVQISDTKRNLLVASANEKRPNANVAVQYDLVQLSQKLKLGFGAVLSKERDSQIHALHNVSQKSFGRNFFVRWNHIPEDDNKTHYLVINETYRQYFKSSQHRTVDRDIKMHWSLATTLVHEIAHAFYARHRTDGVENYAEPLYSLEQCTDDEGELGEALDLMLYGVHWESCIHAEFGAAFQWTPNMTVLKGSKARRAESCVTFPVCPTYVHSWFLEKTWKDMEQNTVAEQVVAFYVPESNWGAVRESIGLKADVENYYWTPRRKLLGTATARLLTGNTPKACIERYEKRNEKALRQLRRARVETIVAPETVSV